MAERQKLIHLHAGTAGKPAPSALELGEIAVNYTAGSEKLYIKNSGNTVIGFVNDNDPRLTNSRLANGGTSTVSRKVDTPTITNPNGAFSEGYTTFNKLIATSGNLAGDANGFPVSNNANGLMTIHTHPGNYFGQLGFSSNERLYYKFTNGTLKTGSDKWKKIAFTSDIPSVPSISINDAGSGNAITNIQASGHKLTVSRDNFSKSDHNHDERYMPLYPTTLYLDNGTSSWGAKIDFCKDDPNYVFLHEDSTDHLRIHGNQGVNITSDDPDTIKANNKRILTDGNIGKYTAYTTRRDFVSGMLIKTSIDYSVASGAPFYMEIKGNTYGNKNSSFLQVQGYVYDNTLIQYGMTNLGFHRFEKLIAMNIDGKLCFWTPRRTYWEGFSVFCCECGANYRNYNENLVTSVEDSAEPNGTKKVNIHTQIKNSAFTNEIPTVPSKLPADGGTADIAKKVQDYGDTSNSLYIGYAGSAITTTSSFAAYTTHNGSSAIKDISVASTKTVLGIPSNPKYTDEHTTYDGHYNPGTTGQVSVGGGSARVGNETTVITNVTRDGKGHVTSVTQGTMVIPSIPATRPNPHSLTIQKNGVNVAVYDGSSAQTANITVPDISGKLDKTGKAADSDKLDNHDSAYFVNTATSQNINGAKSFNDNVKFKKKVAEGSSYANGTKSHSEGCGNETKLALTYVSHTNTPASTTAAAVYNLVVSGNQTSMVPKESILRIDGDFYHVSDSIFDGTNTKLSFSNAGLPKAPTNISKMSGVAFGPNTHSEGYETIALSESAHSEGYQTKALGSNAHAENYRTTAKGVQSHAEGQGTFAGGDFSHSEGYWTRTSGYGCHSSGAVTNAIGNISKASGLGTRTVGPLSSAEGYNAIKGVLTSSNSASKTFIVTFSDDISKKMCDIVVAGDAVFSHTLKPIASIVSVKKSNDASGNVLLTITTDKDISSENNDKVFISVKEFENSEIKSVGGHSEGQLNKSFGESSHSEGVGTLSSHIGSHSEGYETKAGVVVTGFSKNKSVTGTDGLFANGNLTDKINEYVNTDVFLVETNQILKITKCEYIGGENNETFLTLSGNVKGSDYKPITLVFGGKGMHAEGIGTITTNDAEHACGKYNKSNHSSDVNKRTLFSVGCGTSDTDRRNAIEVTNDGNTCIDKTLTINGDSSIGSTISLGDGIATENQLMINNIPNFLAQISTSKDMKLSSGPSCRITLKKTGEVDFTCANGVKSTGGFFDTSDARLKNFKEDIPIDFDTLKNIPKKYFTWKNKEMGTDLQIGTSAQEVQKIYPELVRANEKGELSVSYEKLSIVALKAVDELHDENEKLKKEMEAMKSELDMIKSKLGL